VSDYKPRLKSHYANSLIAVLAPNVGALLAQSPAPTLHSNEAELAKVEEWVLSQGTTESIATHCPRNAGSVNKKIVRRSLVTNSPSGTKQHPSTCSFFNLVWCGFALLTRLTSPLMRKT
jgi:hypothetical protein